MSPNLPPLPEGVIPREVDEEDESESTVLLEEEEGAPPSPVIRTLASVPAARIQMLRHRRLQKALLLVQRSRFPSFLCALWLLLPGRSFDCQRNHRSRRSSPSILIDLTGKFCIRDLIFVSSFHLS